MYTVTSTRLGFTMLRLAQGLVAPLSAVAGMVIMADFSGREKGRLAGVVNQWGSIGMVLGPGVGGGVMQFLGVRCAFWLSSLAVLVGGLVVYFALPRRGSPASVPTAAAAVRGMAARLTWRVYLLGTVNLIDFVAFQAWILLLTIELQARGFAEGLIGTMLTVQCVAYAAAQGFCGRLADRRKGLHAVAIAQFLYGFLVLLLPGVAVPWKLALAMVGLGFASAPTWTGVFVEVSHQATGLTGRAMGLLNGTIGLGNGAGPLLGGLLGSISLQAGFLATSGLLWTNAVLAVLYVVRRHRSRFQKRPTIEGDPDEEAR
ncbi:MAG: MFS transporter [Acetobacteraceae bacterium]|nr:MFS transporter [Acetobacteraceae bacterium]